jgi:hypothetical protein
MAAHPPLCLLYPLLVFYTITSTKASGLVRKSKQACAQRQTGC